VVLIDPAVGTQKGSAAVGSPGRVSSDSPEHPSALAPPQLGVPLEVPMERMR
jgi:hypothetical protein